MVKKRFEPIIVRSVNRETETTNRVKVKCPDPKCGDYHTYSISEQIGTMQNSAMREKKVISVFRVRVRCPRTQDHFLIRLNYEHDAGKEIIGLTLRWVPTVNVQPFPKS